ncbi:Transcription initiation factor TFIID subunit 5 [Vanrija albida]|uniref:Transcription initiation factor TFIID subunit 5 n=1 Tax=Vanrija albida TaxID=181172 RepID=A0ABR3QAT2_9TREE
MSDSPTAPTGPSSHVPRADPPLLPSAVMVYLQQHGFDKALAALQAELTEKGEEKDADGEEEDAGGPAAGAPVRRGSAVGREAIFRAPQPITLDNMVKRNIPQATTVSASTMSDKVTPDFIAQAKYIIEQLQTRLESTNGEEEIGKPGQTPAAFIDPSDRVEGYRRYRQWVSGGLDMWKFELDNVSFPLFAHTFLDLIDFGFTEAAQRFYQENAEAHKVYHPSELSYLSSITASHQILLDPYCQRLRSEKYHVPLSRNAFALLVQWLSGAGLDEEWEAGLHSAPGRAKEAIRSIVNSRLDIKVSDNSMPLDKVAIASSSGLLSQLLPPATSVEKFNAATPLKLGAPPMLEKLREEVIRIVREEDEAAGGEVGTPGGSVANGHANGGDANGDVEMVDASRDPARVGSPSKKAAKLEPEENKDLDLISPDGTETLPPLPTFYKVTDVKREVEAVRDKRKMIRLGPKPDEKAGGSGVNLPSIVAFTLFDGGESVTSVEFSPDSSLVAAGSSESCVRLWSLKDEKLKAKHIDQATGQVTEDEGLAMRKLIGHSGPVYSLSFDPISGSGGPPRSMLSSSQDGTVRLWSLDTYSNLVVYRGHGRDAVWDVEWGPMGVYFASASRDRTARLWSSDRVTPLRLYTGHISDVNVVKFHPNSLYLATGSSDNTCRLWDVQRGACIRLFLGHTDAVTTMALSPDGRTLASAGLDCSIYLWDLGSARPIKKMTGHTAPIESLSFSAESSVLVSGGLDSTVRCWDVKSAGGPRTTRGGIDFGDRRAGQQDMTSGAAPGALPMGPGELSWEDMGQTSDLLSTFHTKRTPILKTHYTPRNLCMVAGSYVPPTTKAS